MLGLDFADGQRLFGLGTRRHRSRDWHHPGHVLVKKAANQWLDHRRFAVAYKEARYGLDHTRRRRTLPGHGSDQLRVG
jgi:hypothetical protein